MRKLVFGISFVWGVLISSLAPAQMMTLGAASNTPVPYVGAFISAKWTSLTFNIINTNTTNMVANQYLSAMNARSLPPFAVNASTGMNFTPLPIVSSVTNGTIFVFGGTSGSKPTTGSGTNNAAICLSCGQIIVSDVSGTQANSGTTSVLTFRSGSPVSINTLQVGDTVVSQGTSQTATTKITAINTGTSTITISPGFAASAVNNNSAMIFSR